jgi:DNA-binding IclR family transcriptional regulator
MVMEHLSSSGEGARITSIGKDLNLSLPVVHRILNTMKIRGFIEQDNETKRYRLGLNARLLGISAMAQTNLISYGLTCLNEISELTDETSNLVQRNNWEAVYVLQVESKNALRVANQVGSRVPLYCTSAGKTLLSYISKDLREQYYEEIDLVALTDNTLVSKERIEKEIRVIKETGIAFDREEQALGEACIATPVFNHNGEVIAAISLSSPATRLNSKKMEEFAKPLLKSGMKLSEQLGFRRTK